MRISILTPDSKMPNLAAMKISAFHKGQGDIVTLNMPIMPADTRYVSVLFDWTDWPVFCPFLDSIGGPGVNPEIKLPAVIDGCRPDYSLYPAMDYSLGYTYRACHRGCEFCVVPRAEEPKDHRSIWEFHDPRFNKIALLNNNTLEDPFWRDTFEEVWNAGLILKDISGFDARLMDEEKARAIARTKFDGQIHLAFDNMKDEKAAISAIELLARAGVKPYRLMFYVLIGFDSSHKENLYRVELLRELGVDPFVMPWNKHDEYQKRFARWVNHKAIFNSTEWKDYAA